MSDTGNGKVLSTSTFTGDVDAFISHARKVMDLNERMHFATEAKRMRAAGVHEEDIEAMRDFIRTGWLADRERCLNEIRANLATCEPGELIDFVGI